MYKQRIVAELWRDSPVEEQCHQIPISEDDLDDRAYSVSCCSSNRSEEKSKRRIEFVDFEVNIVIF